MYSYSMTLTTVSFETKLIIHAFIYLLWGENKTLHVYENTAKKFLIFALKLFLFILIIHQSVLTKILRSENIY